MDADSPADAIAQLLDGEAHPIDDSMKFIEVADGIGLPVDDCDALAGELAKLDVPVDEHFIPFIRSISIVSQQAADTCYSDEEKR